MVRGTLNLIKKIVILEKNFSIKQAMKGQNTMEYTWDINSQNDSVTNVSVGIRN
jgi:hypothetical protein